MVGGDSHTRDPILGPVSLHLILWVPRGRLMRDFGFVVSGVLCLCVGVIVGGRWLVGVVIVCRMVEVSRLLVAFPCFSVFILGIFGGGK